MTNQKNHPLNERAIDEASLLPSGDPIRDAMAKRIESATDERRAAWSASLEENEHLRHELGAVEPPEGLIDRLLAAPDADEFTRRSVMRRATTRRSRPWRSAPLVAATLTLLAAAAAALLLVNPDNSSLDAVERFAALAMRDHMTRPTLTMESNDPTAFALAMDDAVPFQAIVRPISNDARLLGGRVCQFDEAPLLYTRWTDAAGEASVYQIERRRFNLPDGMPPREVSIPASTRSAPECRIIIWSEGSHAFAIVRDRNERGTSAPSNKPTNDSAPRTS